MNYRLSLIFRMSCALGLVLSAGGAAANGTFKARLDGLREVPALSSEGSGLFVARVANGSIRYRLSYRDLGSDVLFAHIHFGQAGVNGGVSAFLCSTAPAPVQTPACPPPGGSVTSVLTAADVVGPAGQGIAPGEFDELLDAIRAGATYVNVHTADFNGGEIRGQIGRGLRHR